MARPPVDLPVTVILVTPVAMTGITRRHGTQTLPLLNLGNR